MDEGETHSTPVWLHFEGQLVQWFTEIQVAQEDLHLSTSPVI
jgi:hypothetical protein